MYLIPQADRMLVQNGQNLMKKILHMMSACEAVCIKVCQLGGHTSCLLSS